MNIQTNCDFGTTPDGQQVTTFRCENDSTNSITLMDYGAHLIGVEMPDRNGIRENVTLGFDSCDGYFQRHPYFGSTVGRFCNRIGNGKFTIDGKDYSLATNNGPNHLHGGVEGFDRYLWKAQKIESDDEVGIHFSRTSPDGEEGYPGNLSVDVLYSLNNRDELSIEFRATTDAPTHVNLTNHTYWNLGGRKRPSILQHQLTISSDKFVAVNENLIPTGEFTDVTETPFDFRTSRAIGERINEIKSDPVGYDHCYVVNRSAAGLAFAASVNDPESGRSMEVRTTQPGIQFYTGNFLDGSKECGGSKKHSAFCLETQHYPDSPNQPTFPTTLLMPGETLIHKTVHRFSVDGNA